MSALSVLDPIEASIVSLLPHGGMVVSMQASFDDSGNSDKSLTIVAGFFFRDAALPLFNGEWRGILDGRRFHMQDLVHGNGDFEDLGDAQRTEMSIKLIDTIKRHVTLGVAISIEQDAYEAYLMDHPELRKTVRSTYAMCSLLCLGASARWMEEQRKPAEETVYFFESGNSKQADANGFLAHVISKNPAMDERYRYVSHSYVKKHKLPSLDAADLLGWEWTQQCRRIMGIEKRKSRKSLKSLAEKPLIYRHYDQKDITMAFVHTLLEPYVTPSYGGQFIGPDEEFPNE